jgi:hypothetical protein
MGSKDGEILNGKIVVVAVAAVVVGVVAVVVVGVAVVVVAADSSSFGEWALSTAQTQSE